MEKVKKKFIYYYKNFFESKICLIIKLLKLLLIIFLLYNLCNLDLDDCINYIIKNENGEIKTGIVIIIMMLIFYT